MPSEKLNIEKWDSTQDGELNVENMEKKLKKQGYSSTMYTFAPGSNFGDHSHKESKKDSIVTGQFEVNIFGETVILQPGDMMIIPANIVHNAKVVGSEPVTFFDTTKDC